MAANFYVINFQNDFVAVFTEKRILMLHAVHTRRKVDKLRFLKGYSSTFLRVAESASKDD